MSTDFSDMSSETNLSIGATSTHIDNGLSKHLWNVFAALAKSTTGFEVSQFQFQPGVTPMSTLLETFVALSIYYVLIFGGQELMRERKAFSLSIPFKIHNLFLTIASGSLLMLFAEQLIPSLRKHGLFTTMCGNPGWTQPLVVLYYINYIIKYIELIDTLFLVLKKKPLTFLHTYHHGATALLCYTQLVGHTPVSWVPITANLLVHVVMYWYYFQSARGVKIWWKEYITQLQILQFVVDLGFIYFASWTYYASAYAPALPHVGHCDGEEFAAFSGCAILSSYLVLFVSFYLSTYKKGKSETRVIKDAARKMEKGKIPDAKQVKEKTEEVLEL